RQVDINSNAQLIAPREGRYLGIAFSPDGNYVYFGYAESARNDAVQIYRLPVLGIGVAPMKIELQAGPPALSHDRKRLAFIRFDREAQTDSLVVANADGSGEQVIGTRRWPQRYAWDALSRPEWTADNQTLMLPIVNSTPSYNGDTSSNYTVTLYEKD